ncbi:hypothetical protein H4R35_004268 [Dimargaris xerosporica]|nr:hypothetical protein H4R35_004268 [Dimargaris xerosporica]
MKVAAIVLIALVATVAFPSSVCSMPTDSSQVTPVDGNAVVEIKLSYITLPGRRLDLRLGEVHANELAEDIFQSAQDETLVAALDKIRQAIVSVAKQPRPEYQMDPAD